MVHEETVLVTTLLPAHPLIESVLGSRIGFCWMLRHPWRPLPMMKW